MFTKWLTEMNAEQPYWRPISLLGGRYTGMKTAADE